MANSGEKEAEQIQNPGTIGLNEGWNIIAPGLGRSD